MRFLQDEDGWIYVSIGGYLTKLTLKDVVDLFTKEELKKKFNYENFKKVYKID